MTIVEIPTVYGGEFGPDLGFVASHNHLTEADVVRIHSGTDYLVYMMGFIPGFTYLGGMNPRIATPRLSSPRTHIPAGSVGIAGEQTGTYPSDSPGGWQLLDVHLCPCMMSLENRRPFLRRATMCAMFLLMKVSSTVFKKIGLFF